MMWLQHNGTPWSQLPSLGELGAPGSGQLALRLGSAAEHQHPFLHLNATAHRQKAGGPGPGHPGANPSRDAMLRPPRPSPTPSTDRKPVSSLAMERMPPLPRNDGPLAFIAEGTVNLNGRIVDDRFDAYRCCTLNPPHLPSPTHARTLTHALAAVSASRVHAIDVLDIEAGTASLLTLDLYLPHAG